MSDRRQMRRTSPAWWAAGVAVAVLAVWFVWSQWDAWYGGGDSAGRVVATVPVADPGGADGAAEAASAEQARLEASWTEVLGGPPAWPVDPFLPGSCEAVSNRLQRACAHLDGAEYFVGEPPPGGSCAILRRVAEALAGNPPSPASELRDFPRILDNTFHLFRTLDRGTVQWLRTVLREEDSRAEPLAYALYSWAITRDGCDERTAVAQEPLADYAAFLFRTLGGQAYLRRRTPPTEALTSFYALMIADHADRAGHNPHGFDPRPELQRTRALIATQPLALREDYLRTLDEIAIRWKEKTGG